MSIIMSIIVIVVSAVTGYVFSLMTYMALKEKGVKMHRKTEITLTALVAVYTMIFGLMAVGAANAFAFMAAGIIIAAAFRFFMIPNQKQLTMQAVVMAGMTYLILLGKIAAPGTQLASVARFIFFPLIPLGISLLVQLLVWVIWFMPHDDKEEDDLDDEAEERSIFASMAERVEARRARRAARKLDDVDMDLDDYDDEGDLDDEDSETDLDEEILEEDTEEELEDELDESDQDFADDFDDDSELDSDQDSKSTGSIAKLHVATFAAVAAVLVVLIIGFGVQIVKTNTQIRSLEDRLQPTGQASVEITKEVK